MRWSLKAYIALVAIGAAILLGHDLMDVPNARHPWSWLLVLALAVLSTAAQHMQFQVARGWFSTAGAVAAISSAMLLPPGLAELVMLFGAASRVIRVRQAPSRALFNVGSATLSIAAAAHLANFFGGPELLTDPNGWPGLPVAAAMAILYYVVSATAVAGAVALDSNQPLWNILRGKVGVKTVAEVGLGLVGATLAAVLTAPRLGAMAHPAGGAVFRPSNRWNAPIVARATWRDQRRRPRRRRHARPRARLRGHRRARGARSLKLDGLALVPIGAIPAFGEHVASEIDRPVLRAALVVRLRPTRQRIDVRGDDKSIGLPLPDCSAYAWPPRRCPSAPMARPVGALIAWRDCRNRVAALPSTTRSCWSSRRWPTTPRSPSRRARLAQRDGAPAPRSGPGRSDAAKWRRCARSRGSRTSSWARSRTSCARR